MGTYYIRIVKTAVIECDDCVTVEDAIREANAIDSDGSVIYDVDYYNDETDEVLN